MNTSPASPARGTEALLVEELHHRYGERVALAGLSLRVAAGEMLALLGPNGSGKTTLFQIAATLLRPTAGRVRVFGEDALARPAAVRRRLGVVFQQPALDRQLTVRENLHLQGALHGLHGAALRARIEELFARLELEAVAEQRAGTLSGGQARRADLARGLLHRPALLLLDEPAAALDVHGRRELMQLLAAERAASGVTIVLTTHLLEQAEAADRVALLDRGRLVALGTPAELRAELPGEVLTVRARGEPAALAARLEQQLGLPVQRLGELLRLEHERGAALAQQILQVCGEEVAEITLGRPTLEDVFIRRTGHRLDETDSGAAPAGAPGWSGGSEQPAGPACRAAEPPLPPGVPAAAGAAGAPAPTVPPPGRWLRPTLAFAGRELRRFARQRGRVVGALGTPLLFWALLGTGFGQHFRVPELAGGHDYLSYFFPGMVVMVVLFTAIFGAIAVIQDRLAGLLQAALVTPVPRVAIALGLALGGALVGLAQGLMVLPLGALVGAQLGAGALALQALVLAGTALGLAAFGLACAWRMESVQSFHAVMNLVLFPAWLLSGAVFPPSGWLGTAMLANPLTYPVAALRRVMFGGGGGAAALPRLPPLPVALAVTFGFAVVALAAASWQVARPQRTHRRSR
ncbi:MAG: hypothetical protein KatS3mg102_1906 [Planctomycetota bacterium]|nr:MAG: hypothetical protein KatS3mg102_1906 [Planctomycetota bacterium]